MGNTGTVQHADYYYFKKDTKIFSNKDGINAQNAAKVYLKYNTDYKYYKTIYQQYNDINNIKLKNNKLNKKDIKICDICCAKYNLSQLDNERRKRLEIITDSDFGISGKWHCPKCSISPLAIYTTWISLSKLTAPRDSILSIAPKTHKLKLWDLPKINSQIPGDFNWKYKWVIPKNIDYGDIIIFNIKTIHASSLNISSPRSFRLSMDTRISILPNNYIVTNQK